MATMFATLAPQKPQEVHLTIRTATAVDTKVTACGTYAGTSSNIARRTSEPTRITPGHSPPRDTAFAPSPHLFQCVPTGSQPSSTVATSAVNLLFTSVPLIPSKLAQVAFAGPASIPAANRRQDLLCPRLRVPTRRVHDMPQHHRQCYQYPCLSAPHAKNAPRRLRPVAVTVTPLPVADDSPLSSTSTPYHNSPPPLYDVVVVGGGPAGLSLSAGLGNRGVHTLCCDATLYRPWPNNYGTWIDELQPLGLEDCVSHVWEKCAAFVRQDGTKSVLDRVYARVDRVKMKQRLIDLCEESGKVTIVNAAASVVDASATDASLVSFENSDQHPPVRGRVVVDATGHKLKFVRFNEGKVPGYQAAYGIECTVRPRSYPFSADEMVLMDFRDDHMQANEFDRLQSLKQPTFIYIMPLDKSQGSRMFFEETSLVASPAMEFDLLKERLYKRLAFYNIEVENVHEEEFCLIPMGGEMPDLRQRVVAFGGAAALVHPATGYMIARALRLADKCASIIASELENHCEDDTADVVSHKIWDRLWNVGRRRQRDFFNFGGEYLRSIDLSTTRDFFSAFFDLPKEQWAGFLSFKLMQPHERLDFGLGVFMNTTNRVRFSIVPASLRYGGLKLLLSVLPIYKVVNEDDSVI